MMLVSFIAQEIIPAMPADPTGLLKYGPLGVLVIFALLATGVMLKLGPKALAAWTEMNVCATRQADVLERTTAAVEEHRQQSATEHRAQAEAIGTSIRVLEQLHGATKQLSDEIRRRNGQ